MKPEDAPPATDAGLLRDRAEAALRKRANATPDALAALAPEATRALLHELQVHQIELEMQNEELRRAQHALEVSRARYFDLYDLAPVGYCTVSHAGLIVEANLTLAELLGAPRSVVVTKPLSRFIFKEDQDLFYHLRQRVNAAAQAPDGQAMSCELRFLRTDGSHFWAHLTATVEPDAKLRVVVTDITARKAAEATRTLLESELVQAQKMESVGRLAGGVAHDFNNMLTVILGNVELAFGEVDPSSPLHQDLVDIRTAAQRSAELTAQLLAYARKQVIAPKVLDLNATVSDTVTMLQRLIGADVQLVWKPGPNLWPVKMDASQVTQILTNLVVNARDALVEGGTITIETLNRSGGDCACAEGACSGRGTYVSLVVTDDGCGMDETTLAHLFEPFFTTKDLGKGTGLGLAMVFGAVKQNHGFVNVRSAPGAGTTFTVCLRRHEEAPALRGGHVPRVPAKRGRETILVVEDEPALLDIIQRLLSEQGYTVLAANTPADALELANAQGPRIDLLLTDIVMPGLNGLDLGREIGEAWPFIKRLFMSGYSADMIARYGRSDEVSPFLQKPFTMAELTDKVRAVLDGK